MQVSTDPLDGAEKMKIWLLLSLVLLAVLRAWLHVRGNFFRARLHPWLEENATLLGAYRSLLWLLTVPVVVIGGYLAFLELRDSLLDPDVSLALGRPAAPVFWVINSSPKLVREPKYQFLVYDLGHKGDPDQFLLLEIPVKILDFIRPGRASGPYSLKSVASNGSQIQDGHHLFGYVEVQCPECVRVRYYWLFVKVGTDGWFAEIPEEKTKTILKELAAVVHGGAGALSRVDTLVPVETRVRLSDAV